MATTLRILVCVLLSGICIPAGSVARAQSFLFSGAPSTYEAGLSQTNTAGPTGVVNNPANVLLSKKYETYADFSIVNINYSYSRAGYSPATLKTTAPPVNFGASWKPISNFALGVFVTPRPAFSAQKIAKLPQDSGGAVQLVDVENKQGTFITGVGAAFPVTPLFSLGVSVMETAEDNQLIVRRAGTSDALVGMRYQGSFLQFQVGYRALIGKRVILAGSYRTSVEKEYKGTEIVKGDLDNSIRRKGYNPSVLAIGGEYKLGPQSVFGEVRREGWAAGSQHYGSGLPGATTSTALTDTFISIAGARMRLKDGQGVSGAIGYYPANVGFGTMTTDISATDTVNGVQFGEFDNLSRFIMGGAYHLTRKQYDLMAGANYISGWQTVPEHYSGAGKYSLSVFTVGVGGGWYF